MSTKKPQGSFGVTSLRSLRRLPETETRAVKLHECGQIVRTFVEKFPNDLSHQLFRQLRAVLVPILKDPEASPDEARKASEMLETLKTLNPRNKDDEEANGSDLLAACQGEGATVDVCPNVDGDDEWEDSGPLSHEEAFRLINLQRPYVIHERGDFVLRPGVSVQKMLIEALDGRSFDTASLLKLYACLKRQPEVGGFWFAGGVLFSEVDRVLRASGMLPPLETQAKTYGQRVFEELLARD